VLIATSVAARGLDVKGLICVINYDCPDHLEDYVHRVGRTGRAGMKGYAYTFITDDDDKYCPSIKKALIQSHVEVPEELETLCKNYLEKVEMKLVTVPGTGFGGKGFKFDEEEENKQKQLKKQQQQFVNTDGKLQYDTGDEDDGKQTITEILAEAEMAENAGEELSEEMKATLKRLEDSKNQMENLFKSSQPTVAGVPDVVNSTANSAAPTPAEVAQLLMQRSKQKYGGKLTLSNIGKVVPIPPSPYAPTGGEPQVQVTTREGITFQVPRNATPEVLETRLRLALVAEAIRLRSMSSSGTTTTATSASSPTTAHYSEDMEINDLPQAVRLALTNKNTLSTIIETTGASVTARGIYIQPSPRAAVAAGLGMIPVQSVTFGKRKLYLCIEGDSPEKIKEAKNMLLAKLREESGNLPIGAMATNLGRFTVVGK
jgi:ATP-dependent RNA helicase DDX46/PRP5